MALLCGRRGLCRCRLVSLATFQLVTNWLISLGIPARPLDAGQHRRGRTDRGPPLRKVFRSHDGYHDSYRRRLPECTAVLGCSPCVRAAEPLNRMRKIIKISALLLSVASFAVSGAAARLGHPVDSHV